MYSITYEQHVKGWHYTHDSFMSNPILSLAYKEEVYMQEEKVCTLKEAKQRISDLKKVINKNYKNFSINRESI